MSPSTPAIHTTGLAKHLRSLFTSGKLRKSWLWSYFLFFTFTSCEQTSTSSKILSVSQGSVSNAATGLKANYRNIETGSVKLVMNDEVLGHTDIPLGEKFYIVNDDIKGLSTKEGKVSVGCSLLITDETGKILLKEPDLFSGNDVFGKDEVTQLRCAVSTGLPMESENHYNIKARFWDKYGDGFIENTLTFRIIDMP